MEAEKLANKAVDNEKALQKLENDFALANPAFKKFLEKQKKIQVNIQKMWDSVKQALINANYTDTIENDNFVISISKVVNLKVEDIDKVPKDLVETVKQVKTDKAKKFYQLYEKIPEGMIDASFYRLNKKIK